MGDLKKDELQKSTENQEFKPTKPRNYTFMGIAALYLIYLGYELCMGFINSKEGSSIGFFLMGVVFIGFGIAVVVYAVKGSRRRHAAMKAAEAAEAAAAAAAEKEDEELEAAVIEEKKAASKKMSIAERARMVGSVVEDETNVDIQNEEFSEE